MTKVIVWAPHPPSNARWKVDPFRVRLLRVTAPWTTLWNDRRVWIVNIHKGDLVVDTGMRQAWKKTAYGHACEVISPSRGLVFIPWENIDHDLEEVEE